MKGLKYDETKAGVKDINLSDIPRQELEYYEYTNWLKKYLLENPNESLLSDEELKEKFKQHKQD
ncbi:MAG: hypothetical protein Q4F97_09295 [Bacteroidales bacterium]|nr:hypothetical protein [Bacteroidales bacterium]